MAVDAHSVHGDGSERMDSQKLTGAPAIIVGFLVVVSASMFALAILAVFARLAWGKLQKRRQQKRQQAKVGAEAAAKSPDDVVLGQAAVTQESDGTGTCIIAIEGMTCAACSGAVERALSALTGVTTAEVNLMANTARVSFKAPLQPQGICDTVEEIGFGASLMSWEKHNMPGATTATLSIEGMTCTACSGAVERALKAVQGVASAEVNLLSSSARICFSKSSTTAAALCEVVEDIGFGASLLAEEQKTASSGQQSVTVAPQTVAVFSIEGMTCTACSGAVERALKAVKGVVSAEVNLLSHSARVCFTSPTTEKECQDAVEEVGFGASLVSTENQNAANNVETPKGMKGCSLATLAIEGMTCAACSGAVEKALASASGVEVAEVNLLASTAKVTFRMSTNAEALCEIVEDIGFGASLVTLQEGIQRPMLGESQDGPLTPKSATSSEKFRQSLPNQTSACLVRVAFPTIVNLRAAQAELKERFGIAGVVPREKERELRVSYWSEQVGARVLLEELKPHSATWAGDSRMGNEDHLLKTARSLRLRYLLSVPPTAAIFTMSMVLPNVFPDGPLEGPLNSEVCCGGALSWKTLLLLVLATPVQFGCGMPMHRAALRALRVGHLSMDVLVSLGTTMAYMYSLVVTLVWIIVGSEMPSALASSGQGAHHKASVAPPPHFFEASAMLLSILMLGKCIESHAKRKTSDSLRELASHWPTEARLAAVGGEPARSVPCDLLEIGDIVAITVGETCPCDGIVLSGDMHVDESVLTGEDCPVRKTAGDLVVGGSKCHDGAAQFTAAAVAANTAMSQIARMVETAQSSKPDIERVASKVAAIFVPTILALSLLTFCVWALLVASGGVEVPTALKASAAYRSDGQLTEARMAEESFFISRFALALMMMACPCAFGLAAPTAVLVATGAAARRGCLIKSGQALEVAQQIKAIVLDKTGTVTVGKPTVTHVALCDAHPRLAQPLPAELKLKQGAVIDQKQAEWLPSLGETVAPVTPPMGTQAALLWAAVGAVEGPSQHPLGKSIHAHACTLLETVPEVDEWQSLTGLGVEGRVAGLGWVRVGRLGWVLTGKEAPLPKAADVEEVGDANEKSGLLQGKAKDPVCSCPDLCRCTAAKGCGCSCWKIVEIAQPAQNLDKIQGWLDNMGAQGAGVVVVSLNNQLLGAVVMRDVLQPGAPATVKALQARGIDVWLCSGDAKSTTRAVAAELGIKNWIGEAMPTDKARHVAELAAKVPVAFVGDGVNDAVALGAATLGVAIGAGAHVTVDAADVVLVRSAFEDFLGFVQLSGMTLRTIRMNYVWAFGFNIIGLPLAAGLFYPHIHLPPVVAGAAMAGSSLMVVCNSLRLRSAGAVWKRQVAPSREPEVARQVDPSRQPEVAGKVESEI